MANEKPLFRTLNDPSNPGAGVAQDKKNEGDAKAGNHAAILPAIDPSNNLQFLKVNANGELIVDTESPGGTCKKEYAANDAGSTSYVDLPVYVAALEKVHARIGISVASMTAAEWELVYVDDVGGADTEEIIATFMTGPGAHSYCCELNCWEISTVGKTNVQNIKIRGKNLWKASRLTASLTLTEQ